MKTEKRASINLIAENIIEEILNIKDPFSTPIVVCHNSKVLQWFKDYFLKTQSGVLMNVRFETLPVLLNGFLNPDEEFTILDKNTLRDYIIRELLTTGKYTSLDKNITDYIKSGADFNGSNLYELAEKLASLFMFYEFDNEDITSFGWESDLYEGVMKTAESENYFSTKRLFKKRSDENSIEKTTEKIFVIDNSRITVLFKEILEAYCDSNTTLFEIDASIELEKQVEAFSAPSKLRGIEELHSRICEIVKNDKDVRFNDFLVYAPNINEYSAIINRVFKQDGTNFPYIPFRIVGEIREKKDMIDSLNILFDIANKRFFTRYDFFKFIKNAMLQYVHDYTDEDIDIWMDAIVKTNTHRNGKNLDSVSDDWDYLKKRLLTSVLVSSTSEIENKTELSDGFETLPFSSINLDMNTLSKMLDIIDLLKDWCSLFADDLDKLLFNGDKVNELTECLNKLYSRKKKSGAESNYLYRKVSNELAFINNNILSVIDNIPATTLLRLILSTPNAFLSYPADMFSAGVTFMNFESDDVVSAKYVYILGMSSNVLPRVDLKNEIDYSKNHNSGKELDDISVKNILRNCEYVTFSFVNRDTKTEEEFFPSSYIEYYCGSNIEKITLDETREYKKLFTHKEFKDKKYYDSLTNSPSAATSATSPSSSASASLGKGKVELSTKDFEEFLKNTFVYKYNAMLKQNDDKEEEYSEEFDLIDDDNLAKYNTVKKMIMAASPSDCKEKLFLEQQLPSNGLEEEYYKYYNTYNDNMVDFLRSEIESGYSLLNLSPIELDDGTEKWILKQSKTKPVYRKEEGNLLYYLEPIELNDEPHMKFFLYIYSVALMDVAGRKKEGETNYTISLACSKKSFDITPLEAIKLLNALEKMMTDFSDIRYMDIEFIHKKRNPPQKDYELPVTLKEFVSQINGKPPHYTWTGFNAHNMISLYKDVGYDSNSFNDSFNELIEIINNLIVF